MGWHNPSVSWPELERRLAGRPARAVEPADAEAPTSRRRPPYRPKELPKQPDETVRYAELHCHSNFSFLDGASHPEELVEEAARLGLETLALTDHDGFYGVVRLPKRLLNSAFVPFSARSCPSRLSSRGPVPSIRMPFTSSSWPVIRRDTGGLPLR